MIDHNKRQKLREKKWMKFVEDRENYYKEGQIKKERIKPLRIKGKQWKQMSCSVCNKEQKGGDTRLKMCNECWEEYNKSKDKTFK